MADQDDVDDCPIPQGPMHCGGWPTSAAVKDAYPGSPGCLQVVATQPGQDVVTVFFEGNRDRGFLSNFITSFAYVNGYTVLIQPSDF